MHNARLHLLGFPCCLPSFSFSLPAHASLACHLSSARLPGSCGVAGGGLEGGLPHGFLLQSELRAVGAQSPRQPTCAGAAQTGEPDERMNERRGREAGWLESSLFRLRIFLLFIFFLLFFFKSGVTLTPSGVISYVLLCLRLGCALDLVNTSFYSFAWGGMKKDAEFCGSQTWQQLNKNCIIVPHDYL